MEQEMKLLPLREANGRLVVAEPNLSMFEFFMAVMKNAEAHEPVLSIIMNDRELKLVEVKVEEVILNENGRRGIRLDAWAIDSKDRQYVTEMQNDTQNDDMRKRSRYYQSLLDSPILKAGKNTKYKQLPSSFVIFITQDDIFGRDLAMYTFTERCRELPDLELDDGTQKIFWNMKSKTGRPELVSLLQYMKKTDINNPEIIVKDERIMKLDRVVTEVKQTEE